MLKFINKEGKTMVELRDNGDMLVKEVDLHRALSIKENVINTIDEIEVEKEEE